MCRSKKSGPDVEKAEKPKLASNGFHEAKSVQSIPSVKNLDSVAPLPIKLKRPPLERHKSFDEDSFSSKSSHVSALAPLAPKKEVLNPSNVKSYSIADLQMATESFSVDNLLVEGSMGCVYRAEFDDGKVLAVKKVDAAVISNCLEDFTEIVANISRLHHPNVSELVSGQHLLVYEYHNTRMDLCSTFCIFLMSTASHCRGTPGYDCPWKCSCTRISICCLQNAAQEQEVSSHW